MRIYTSLLIVLFSFFSVTLVAQVSHIGGVVNAYAAVSALNLCENKVVVDNTSGFSVGKEVLMIQMKGAFIRLENTTNYGNIDLLLSCGNYEINRIKAINGNEIVFDFEVLREYQSQGLIQLVTVEKFGTAIIDSALRAAPWSGIKGGIICVKADTIILNDSITVKGLGFRGAALNNETSCFNGGNGGAKDYFYSNTVGGAPKGEGNGNTPFPFGRGKNGNGGGGGNDHNTGGGGGSNFGKGGTGGTRTNVSNFSCPGPGPGDGGTNLPYNPTLNKLFWGGGGGAGDENNNEGTAGANGGGLCYLSAKVMVCNNQKINAAGNSVTLKALSDGAGGGGGGGTVVLDIDNIQGSITIDVHGGDGGTLNNGNDPNFCFGPGAGGGGGALWVKGAALAPTITLIDSGGINGRKVTGLVHPNCPNGSTNGATPGEKGGFSTNFSPAVANLPFVPFTASACCDTIVCSGQQVLLSASGSGSSGPSFAWSTGEDTTTILPIVGATTVFNVSVTNAKGCELVFPLIVSVPILSTTITAQPDSAILLGQSVQLQASGPAVYTYAWSPADALSSVNTQNTIATPERTTTYCVTVTDTYACTTSGCYTIDLILPDVKIPDAFSPNVDGTNDRFEIFPIQYAEVFNIRIFNRWGEIIFESKGLAAWDGTYRGFQQPAGDYVIQVTYGSPLTPGKTKTIAKGFTLLR
jgi:gliding motility-associated-like protein